MLATAWPARFPKDEIPNRCGISLKRQGGKIVINGKVSLCPPQDHHYPKFQLLWKSNYLKNRNANENWNWNANSLVSLCYLKWGVEFDQERKKRKINEGVSFIAEFIKQKVLMGSKWKDSINSS